MLTREIDNRHVRHVEHAGPPGMQGMAQAVQRETHLAGDRHLDPVGAVAHGAAKDHRRKLEPVAGADRGHTGTEDALHHPALDPALTGVDRPVDGGPCEHRACNLVETQVVEVREGAGAVPTWPF